MQYRFTYDNRRKVATRMLAAYLKQPYSYHRVHPSSELMRNISTDTERMFDCVLSILQLLTEACVCVVLGVYLFIMDKTITVGVSIIMGGFLFVFYKGFRDYLSHVGNENTCRAVPEATVRMPSVSARRLIVSGVSWCSRSMTAIAVSMLCTW